MPAHSIARLGAADSHRQVVMASSMYSVTQQWSDRCYVTRQHGHRRMVLAILHLKHLLCVLPADRWSLKCYFAQDHLRIPMICHPSFPFCQWIPISYQNYPDSPSLTTARITQSSTIQGCYQHQSLQMDYHLSQPNYWRRFNIGNISTSLEGDHQKQASFTVSHDGKLLIMIALKQNRKPFLTSAPWCKPIPG